MFYKSDQTSTSYTDPGQAVLEALEAAGFEVTFLALMRLPAQDKRILVEFTPKATK